MSKKSIESVRKDYLALNSEVAVKAILNSLPNITMIFNEEEKLVYANSALLAYVKVSSLKEVLGQSLGEIIHCVNATENLGGCGNGKKCKVCGRTRAFQQCREIDGRVVKESSISIREGNRATNYIFKISATPLHINQKRYYIFSFEDISEVRRRRVHERIFFHDILNTVSSLRGYLEFIGEGVSPDQMRRYLERLKNISQDLIDEILEQRDLLSAENGEYAVQASHITACQIIQEIKEKFLHQEISHGKEIEIYENLTEKVLILDVSLLKRVLSNMVKNALEAIEIGESITVGADAREENIVFWVHNPGYISEEDQLQIFKRAFSTKGPNRGLGTYSMKLLTEQYLKGRVSFSSSEQEGTIFKILIPIK